MCVGQLDPKLWIALICIASFLYICICWPLDGPVATQNHFYPVLHPKTVNIKLASRPSGSKVVNFIDFDGSHFGNMQIRCLAQRGKSVKFLNTLFRVLWLYLSMYSCVRNFPNLNLNITALSVRQPWYLLCPSPCSTHQPSCNPLLSMPFSFRGIYLCVL